LFRTKKKCVCVCGYDRFQVALAGLALPTRILTIENDTDFFVDYDLRQSVAEGGRYSARVYCEKGVFATGDKFIDAYEEVLKRNWPKLWALQGTAKCPILFSQPTPNRIQLVSKKGTGASDRTMIRFSSKLSDLLG
jgi:hypothetical protein